MFLALVNGYREKLRLEGEIKVRDYSDFIILFYK